MACSVAEEAASAEPGRCRMTLRILTAWLLKRKPAWDNYAQIRRVETWGGAVSYPVETPGSIFEHEFATYQEARNYVEAWWETWSDERVKSVVQA